MLLLNFYCFPFSLYFSPIFLWFIRNLLLCYVRVYIYNAVCIGVVIGCNFKY